MIKVELGCGTTKNDGYIGIDRFPLPNVDIVADLNTGIPLDSDSVDIIFCSHSLEHFNDLNNIISEIYRVCKHKAIVNILAPYHMESVNLANFYHKIVFNESTFRFFTDEEKTSIDARDYYNPHASLWGLASSDNSNSTINLVTLSMEYFYFPGYENLSDEEKRNARKSLVNVCDQIYYSLAINKSVKTFTDGEIIALCEKAKYYEVPIINNIRNRNLDDKINFNILNNIKKWDNIVLTKQELAEVRLAKRIDENNLNLFKLEQNFSEKVIQSADELNKKLNIKINENRYELNENLNIKINENRYELNRSLNQSREEVDQNISDINKKLKQSNETIFFKINEITNKNIEIVESIKKDFEILKQENLVAVQNIQNQLNFLTAEKNSLAAIALDLVKEKERNRYFILFKKKQDMYYNICNHRNYMDGVILCNNNFTNSSIVNLSKVIPYNSYFEYRIFGYGKRINYFVISNIGAKLFVELVEGGKIVRQEYISIMQEGPFTIILDEEIRGEIYIRFKTLDNYSIIRVLEISNRKFLCFSKKSLAAYIN